MFRGKIVVALLRKGWRPPPLTDAQADRLLYDMESINTGRAGRRTLELSEQEKMVLTLIAHGKSEPRVADELGRSAETVAKHTAHARDKLGARNTVNAVAIAVDQGIIHSASGWREAA